MSGDYNPIHIDEDYAKQTLFKKCIAHGGITVNFISNVLGNDFPGHGSIFLEQDIKYVAPVYEGDEITAYISVKDINCKKGRILLDTIVKNQDNAVVVSGTAYMLLL